MKKILWAHHPLEREVIASSCYKATAWRRWPVFPSPRYFRPSLYSV